jgi:HEAT repeat protein
VPPHGKASKHTLAVWDDEAAPSILAALSDDAWRVREMATRVVIRHRLSGAIPRVKRLRNDPNPRVRKAAERAVIDLSADD